MSKKYLSSNSDKTDEEEDAQRKSTFASSSVSNSELNKQIQYNGGTVSGDISIQQGQTWG